jgi:hypothetical protein
VMVGAGLCACPGQPHWVAPYSLRVGFSVRDGYHSKFNVKRLLFIAELYIYFLKRG